MANFVLVHGAWGGGWSYDRLAQDLWTAGHRVVVAELSGLGKRRAGLHPGITLTDHVDDVCAQVEAAGFGRFVLVGHSYGGMVITGAADRAAERVGHRVYLDAAYPQDGQSLVDHAPMVEHARAAGRVVDGVELVLFPGTDPLGFYGVTDPETIAWMKPRLTPHPWACFEQKLRLRNEAAMRAIPESHIICTQTIPGRNMDKLRANSQGRIWDIDTGHDLMLTEPDWVADRLCDVAATGT